MRLWCVLVLTSACGRLGFGARDLDAAVGDAGADAADAPVDAPCTLTAWSAPVGLASVNSAADDYGATLSPDGNLLVFATTRTGVNDLYAAPRTGTLTFGAPVELSALDTAATDWGPAWSAAGDQLYFASDRGGSSRLYASAFSGTFGAPQLFAQPAEPVFGPVVSADGLELFYNTTATGGQLKRATRTSAGGMWNVVGEVAELNSASDDGWPTLSHDGLTIYFASSRSGNSEIYEAVRSQVGAMFGAPVVVPELGGASDDTDPDLSPDGLTMLLASTRGGGAGGYDVYASTRTCQ